ncbi:peptide deformylase [Peptoniphilus asaccharolyticus]
MAIRNVRIDGDPILRKKSKEVSEVTTRVRELISDMYDTMYDSDGVGIAAVQVGILKRIVVIDDREGNKFTLINPVIKNPTGEQLGMEGCLSVPQKQGRVKRYNELELEYTDESGERHEVVVNEFLARIVQHELDHLDGVLYSDRAEEMYDLSELEDISEE